MRHRSRRSGGIWSSPWKVDTGLSVVRRNLLRIQCSILAPTLGVVARGCRMTRCTTCWTPSPARGRVSLVVHQFLLRPIPFQTRSLLKGHASLSLETEFDSSDTFYNTSRTCMVLNRADDTSAQSVPTKVSKGTLVIVWLIVAVAIVTTSFLASCVLLVLEYGWPPVQTTAPTDF